MNAAAIASLLSLIVTMATGVARLYALISEIVVKSETLSAEDKQALIASIRESQSKVTEWE